MGKERQVAEQILQYVGGKENILNVEHCATRLRLVLKDAGAFRKKEIEEIEGVKGSFLASGQHQVVLGTGFVNKVYAEVMDLTGFDQGGMMTKAYHPHSGGHGTVYGCPEPDHQSGGAAGPDPAVPVPGAD